LYAWQAGYGDRKTRTFNIATTTASSTTTGIAYFGFGPEISVSTNRGTIEKMICNWSQSPTNDALAPTEAQKQTMTLTGGRFVADASNITYDPNNSCESADASFGLTWIVNGGGTRTADTTTNDLVAVSEISTNITIPPLPATL
jgi:hypothetical protein